MAPAGSALFLAVITVLLGYTVRFLPANLAIVRYPYQMEFGEGLVLSLTERLKMGDDIYQPIEASSIVVSNYPPAYYYLVSSVFGGLAGGSLKGGRLLSFLSTIAISIIIALLVLRTTGSGLSGPAKVAGPAIAAFLFLNSVYSQRWGALMRVDMLAVALAVAGVYVFIRQIDSGWRVFLSIPLFLLAAYTKQSSLTAPAACSLALILVRPRLAFAFIATLIILVFGLYFASVWLFGSHFLAHTVWANVAPPELRMGLSSILQHVRVYPLPVIVSLVVTVGLFGRDCARLTGFRRGRRSVPGSISATWPRDVLSVYWAVAIVAILAGTRVGSSTNFRIELMAVEAGIVGLVVSELLRGRIPKKLSPGAHTWAAMGPVVLGLALVLQVLWPAAWIGPRPPSDSLRERTGRVLDLVAATEGPVLSEDLTLLVLAGKPVEYEPFMSTQLAARGTVQHNITERVQNGEFSLIVLEFDLDDVPSWRYRERFSPEVVSAARTHYALLTVEMPYRVYAPR